MMNMNSSSNLKCQGNHLAEASVEANRFCRRCLTLICFECLLESHSDHVEEAKLKIEDVLTRGKEEFANYLTKVTDQSAKLLNVNTLPKADALKKKIEANQKERLKELEILRNKIDSLIEAETEMGKVSQRIVDSLSLPEMKSPAVDKIEQHKVYIGELVRDWDSYAPAERINLIQTKKLMEEDLVTLIVQVKNYKPPSSNESNLADFERQLSKMREMNDTKSLEEQINSMNNKFAKHIELLRKMHSEGKWTAGTHSTDSSNIIITKGPVVDDLNRSGTPKPLTPNIKSVFTDSSASGVGQGTKVASPPIQTPGPVDPPAQNQFLITMKSRTSEILIYNPAVNPDAAEVLRIEDNCFIENRPALHFPPEYSKHVNIGDSLLITGGMDKGQSIRDCFLLKITRDNNKYNAIISPYPLMFNNRERHNMLYLKDKKAVLACGGFYTKSAEVTSLETNTWTELAQMKEQRANATMLYQNNKTVYCFGGFQVGEKQGSSTGAYLGSCEFINVHVPGAVWNFVDLEHVYKVNLKLCAMGVIPLRQNSILLLGGYDGHKYLSCLHEISFEDDKLNKITKKIEMHPSIPRGVIFPASAEFLRWGEIYYNFDFQLKVVNFDSRSGTINSK